MSGEACLKLGRVSIRDVEEEWVMDVLQKCADSLVAVQRKLSYYYWYAWGVERYSGTEPNDRGSTKMGCRSSSRFFQWAWK